MKHTPQTVTEIHLGYEIGTGKPVSIPLGHVAITGQTQLSGKTTTLEALIVRSNLRALTFVTKRGEAAFQDTIPIRPYLKERTDWQYVAAILEATLREKLKFERSWIMKVCKGARTLQDVQDNIERDLKKARGLTESVLTTLHAYLEMILPQIEATTFAPSIDLKPGVNVMDLSEFRLELQSLIIRSAIEWVYEKEESTIVLIPEAWEFIPANRGSPVKLACEQLIRKGGALKNYVWLDAQDIAIIHNDILRSVSVWILGVQREQNEVKRTLAHVGGGAKPKVSELMELGLGEFFACFGKKAIKTYVQPAWADSEAARKHAMGKGPVPAQLINRIGRQPPPANIPASKVSRKEAMWQERYEELKREFDELKRKYEALTQPPAAAPQASSAAPPDGAGREMVQVLGPVALSDDLYAAIRARLVKDPVCLKIATIGPALEIEVKRETITIDGNSLQGRLGRLIHSGFFDSAVTAYSAFAELKKTGADPGKANVYKAVDKLRNMGFLIEATEGQFQVYPDMKKNIKVTAAHG